MKILVAGGAGFIGCNLVEKLLQKGHDVVCVDNFFIGTRENIKEFMDNPRFTLYEQDLGDLEALKKIFTKEQFEYVYHMAANSDIQASAANPEIEYKNTYTTTFNILECMRLCGVKRFFFCSTSAIYGDADGKPFTEESPLKPISYYGACKLGSEGLINAFTYMNDLHTLVFRFPNVIGPHLTHGVIFDFVKRLKENPKELRILGDGKQSKPYIYVTDLVDAIVSMTERDLPQGVTLYNVGVDSQTSVTRIAEIVCEAMGLRNVKFNYTGGRGGWKGDVPVFAYDLSKVHATGWSASMTSDEAVAATAKAVV